MPLVNSPVWPPAETYRTLEDGVIPQTPPSNNPRGVAVPEAVSVLEQIDVASGTWYAATDLTCAVWCKSLRA